MNKKLAQTDTFRPIIGIDLGTTNSGAAYIRKKKPTMVQINDGESTIPSIVLKNQAGKIIVGEDARSALIAMPNRTIAAVKRMIGKEINILLGGESYTPEEISAFILRELKQRVDEQLGEGAKEAVITVPAYFTNEQRQATKRAGELAGFFVERIINEPTAAALAYGMQHLEENKHILVYDLGGGTFDVSIVEMMDGILEVKASAGNHHLGGEDFDWLLVDWLSEKMMEEHGVDPREDVRGKARLKEEAERIKMKLSVEESVFVAIPVITVKDNEPVGLETEITRAMFISLIESMLAETEQKLRDVLLEAELKVEEIDEILLVGGSTRIPEIHEMIERIFAKKARSNINPDEVVALGAGVQAGLKSGALADSGLIVTDVAPFSMGIAVLSHQSRREKPGAFQAIIPRNTTIPVTRKELFSTTYDNQTAVNIEIYQGENDWVKDNYFLNGFLLEGLPKKPAGQEAVEVTFRYNLNGILEVTAKSVSTEKELTSTVIDALDRSTEEAFQDSLAKVEAAYDIDIDELDDSDKTEEMEDYMEDEKIPESLLEEAKTWKERFRKESDRLEGKQKELVVGMVAKLDDAVATKDTSRLNEAIEESIDVAIDIDL